MHKKTEIVKFAVSEADRLSFASAARNAGLSLSAWVRMVAIQASRNQDGRNLVASGRSASGFEIDPLKAAFHARGILANGAAPVRRWRGSDGRANEGKA